MNSEATIRMIQALDEEIVAKIVDRHARAVDPVNVDAESRMEEWATSLDVGPKWLEEFLRFLDGVRPYQRHTSFAPDKPLPGIADLQAILPVMRTGTVHGLDFSITHVNQYTDSSVVHGSVHFDFAQVQLGGRYRYATIQVHVDGETYTGRSILWRGSGWAFAFYVPSRLPDNLAHAKFHLAVTGIEAHRFVPVAHQPRVGLKETDHRDRPNLSRKKRPLMNPGPPYRAEFRETDTEIVQLVKKRVKLTKSQPLPDAHANLLSRAREWNVDTLWLKHYALVVNHTDLNRPIGDLGPIVSTLQPKIGTQRDGIDCRIVSVDQYEACSVVQIQVSVHDNLSLKPRPTPTLGIHAPYVVSHYRGGGGGQHVRASFLVSPRLPDDLRELRFTVEFEESLVYETEKIPFEHLRF